ILPVTIGAGPASRVSVRSGLLPPPVLQSRVWLVPAAQRKLELGPKEAPMKIRWIRERTNYDGSQLQSLFAYRQWGILGPSCVAFRGACEVSFDHMVDLEDLRAESAIRGSDMVHFIAEVFDRDLF